MGWPPEALQLPDDLKHAILSEKCVAFLGSGVSAGCYDNWPDLVNGLCERCGSNHRVRIDSLPETFLDAAQHAKDCSKKSYYEFLGDRLGRSADRARLLYDVLLALPFECYLTVNLDPLLALKARTASRPCSPKPPYAYPALDRKTMTDRTIHYLHGMISEGNTPAEGTIVLARDEFEQAYAPNSSLMNLLVSTLDNEPIAFIGCRLREPVMEHVFRICRDNQQSRMRAMTESRGPESSPPPQFIMLPKPEVLVEGRFDIKQSQDAMPVEEEYYKTMGIKVVWYTARGTEHSALRLGLEHLAQLPDVRPNYGWTGGPYDG